MSKVKGRLILFLIILAVSLVLLLWGFWPLVYVQRVLPLPPDSLQLPTPGACLPGSPMLLTL